MNYKRKVFKLTSAAIFILLFLVAVTGCGGNGGGGSASNGDGSDWDTMVWDQDNWH